MSRSSGMLRVRRTSVEMRRMLRVVRRSGRLHKKQDTWGRKKGLTSVCQKYGPTFGNISNSKLLKNCLLQAPPGSENPTERCAWSCFIGCNHRRPEWISFRPYVGHFLSRIGRQKVVIDYVSIGKLPLCSEDSRLCSEGSCLC